MTNPQPIRRSDGSLAESETPERHGFSRSREEFVGAVNASISAAEGVHPEESKDLSGEIRPADLRGYTGTLYVINKTRDIISHDDGKGNYMRIEPTPHPDSVKPLPLEVAMHTGFQRLWRTGRIRVTKDPSVEDLLTLAEVPESMGGILPYTLDGGQNKDLTPFECLVCTTQMFLSKEDQEGGVPPLCEAHIDSVGLIEQVHDENDNRVWRLKKTVVNRTQVATLQPKVKS